MASKKRNRRWRATSTASEHSPSLSADAMSTAANQFVNGGERKNQELLAANQRLLREVDALSRRLIHLESNPSRFRALAESAQEAVISADSKGIISYFNPAAERIFGYAEPEAIGKPVTLLIPERFRQAYRQGLARYLTTGEGRMVGQTAEFMAQGKLGGEFPIELSLSVAPTDDGPMFTVIIRDIRERKKLQREVLEVAGLEQRRLGQDLHDSIGQELTALGLFVDNLIESLEQTERPESGQARKIADHIRRLLAQTRALSRGLMPVESDATGLMTALTDLAARIGEQGVIKCTFHCPTPVPLENNATATHLFRIAQEAVANGIKHGKAKAIDIDLREHDNHILLQVRDDGKGIGPPEIPSGIGLKTMRYRAGLISAVLTLESGDGNGTVMTCTVPREE